MKLSVIVPLYGFQPQRDVALQNLLTAIDAQDLRVCDANNDPTEVKDFEVIVVEQRSDDVHTLPTRPHLKHITLPAQKEGFNKSWCMNVGAKAAGCDHLVFLDVDMVFGTAFFSKINYFINNLKFFTCWSYIVSMPGKDMPVAKIITRDIMTAGGAFFINRKFYWNAGGMNENYYGYGGEDNDLWVRVNPLLGEKGRFNVVSMPYALGHTYHDWAAPSPDRFFHLNRTVQFVDEVTKRLRGITDKVGNPAHPTRIDVSDLKLPEAGIEEKGGKGLV